MFTTEDDSIECSAAVPPRESCPFTVNWVKTFLTFCDGHTQKFLSAHPDEKTSLFPEVSELWRQFADITKVCKQSVVKAAADQFAITENAWRVLYRLLSLLLKAGKLLLTV